MSMTDRKASFEGLFRLRHRSPVAEASPDHFESDWGSDPQFTSSVPQQRSLRAKTTPNETPHPESPAWADTDKSISRKAKGSKVAPRKVSKAVSPAFSSPEHSSAEAEKDHSGFLPKLSRILEGRESRTPRHQGSSTVSPGDGNTPTRRRRRPTENATLSRRPIRQKHGSLQRRAESLSELPNPSLLSVLSGFTQQSNTSNGSNSTITQQSYDKGHVTKRKPIKERRRLQTRREPPPVKGETMDSRDGSVFQYMNQPVSSGLFNGRPQRSRSSTASSSSSVPTRDTDDEDASSRVGEPVVESPPTSPASMKRLDHREFHDDEGTTDDDGSADGKSYELRHQPSVSDDSDEEGEEEEEAHEDELEDDNSEDENEDDDEHGSATSEWRAQEHAHSMALERAQPPRLPSASSSQYSDRHTRRLRRQEQALSEHVLQYPQPQRDFHFAGAPSPQHPQAAMPMFEAYPYSGASPVNHYITAQQAPPPAPLPPRIGYYSPPYAPPVPHLPGDGNHYAMIPRPPMEAPSGMAQPPPFPYPPSQPPHYQPHPTGPDLTKTTVAGYELLADKLSEGSQGDRHGAGDEAVVPVYRKFEHLNHRVLLHIQDEISEMEEELRYLDECVAQSWPRDEAGRLHPASRRGDALYGSDLHYRRTELLGRVYLKLGQYNSALSSFVKMLKNMNAADTGDVQAYRSWIEQRMPIDASETRFLERRADLLALPQGRSASTAAGVASPQPAAIWLPLILVLPLMAFAVVPGLPGRLVVLLVMGAAMTRLLTSTKELMDMMTVQEWTGCFSVYFGIMAVLAAFAH